MDSSPLGKILALLLFFLAAGYFAFGGSEEWDMTHAEIEPATETFVETYFDQAVQARAAIKQGSFSEAETIINSVLQRTEMGAWEYYPFANFIDLVVPEEDEIFIEQINKWAEQSPENFLPYTIRALYFYNLAWKFRGSGFASTVKEENWKIFHEYIIAAMQQINYALYLKPSFPYGYNLSIRIATPLGEGAQKEVFKVSKAKFPDMYGLYITRLWQLMPRWNGSHLQMVDFVAKQTASLPENHPRRMLILNVYGNLLDDFDLYCKDKFPNLDKKTAKEFCLKQRKVFFESNEVKQELTKVFKLMNAENAFEFNEFIAENGNLNSFAVYEAGWPVIGRDNYGLSYTVGHYYVSGKKVAEYYDDALYFYKKALAEAREFEFPSAEARNIRIAKTYSSLARAMADAMSKVKEKDPEGFAKYASLNQLKQEDVISYANLSVELLPNSPGVLRNACVVYNIFEQKEIALKHCKKAYEIAGSDGANAEYIKKTEEEIAAKKSK